MSAVDRHRSHAALMDRVYRHQRHIYDLDPQILSARPRPDDRRPRPAGRRHACSKSAAAPAATSSRRPARYPDGAPLRPRHLRRDAGDRRAQAVARAGLAGRIALARADASALRSPAALFGARRFDRIFISYALSMIPDWRRRIARSARRAQARRLAAHRRFRPAGTTCRAGFAQPCGPGSAVPRHAA